MEINTHKSDDIYMCVTAHSTCSVIFLNVQISPRWACPHFYGKLLKWMLIISAFTTLLYETLRILCHRPGYQLWWIFRNPVFRNAHHIIQVYGILFNSRKKENQFFYLVLTHAYILGINPKGPWMELNAFNLWGWAGLTDVGWGHLTGYKVQICELKVRHPGDKESNQKVSSCITQGAQLSALWQPSVVVTGCGWREVQEAGDICILMADSCCCIATKRVYGFWLLAAQKPINRPGWWKEKFALFQTPATDAGGGWQMFVQRSLPPQCPTHQQAEGWELLKTGVGEGATCRNSTVISNSHLQIGHQ